MEQVQIETDIRVLVVQASSFPAGVGAAHQKLHSLVSPESGRRFFGISNPGKNGEIIYKAAAEELFPGEVDTPGCDTFIIPRGNYIAETLTDWRKDETIIGKTFMKLLADPRIDRNGFCLEIYLDKNDVQCLVKLADQS